MARWFACLIVLTLAVAARANGASPPPAPDETVLPSETDNNIHTFNNPEGVYRPQGTARGQLFLFLSGTNGNRPFARRLCTIAAGLGYHIIQPMYPDDISASVCRDDKDADAFAKFRWAIIEGGETRYLPHPVPRAESIENRTIKLLAYLQKKHPDQAWGQFVENGQIAWEKLVVGGMSQGGGHAALIATRHRVARVLCFGAPKDYSLYSKSPAKWYETSVTPAECYFAFNNTHDKQACDYQQQLDNLAKLGVNRVGGTADVDSDAPPYHGAHVLFTSWPGKNQEVPSRAAHGSVITDALSGKDGSPRFAAVWTYMLTAPTDPATEHKRPPASH